MSNGGRGAADVEEAAEVTEVVEAEEAAGVDAVGGAGVFQSRVILGEEIV